MFSLFAVSILIFHAAFMVTFWVLAALSKIFGEAKKKQPLYKLFYAAGAIVFVALVLELLGLEKGYSMVLPMALDGIGLFLGCMATHFYWKWLPRELARG